MTDLTLDQVREAGRFAWHGSTIDPDGHFDGDLWADGRYVRIDTDRVHAGLGSPMFTTGWHHLPGCDCEYCEPHALPITRHLTLPDCKCEFCKEA